MHSGNVNDVLDHLEEVGYKRMTTGNYDLVRLASKLWVGHSTASSILSAFQYEDGILQSKTVFPIIGMIATLDGSFVFLDVNQGGLFYYNGVIEVQDAILQMQMPNSFELIGYSGTTSLLHLRIEDGYADGQYKKVSELYDKYYSLGEGVEDYFDYVMSDLSDRGIDS